MKKITFPRLFLYLASIGFFVSATIDTYYKDFFTGLSDYFVSLVFLLFALAYKKK